MNSSIIIILVFSSVTPFVVLLVQRARTPTKKLVLLTLCSALVSLCLFFLGARAALLAYLYIVSLQLLNISYFKRRHIYTAVISFAISIIFFKVDSSLGRVLIYKVCFFEMKRDWSLLYTGTGPFEIWYNKAQGSFFRQGLNNQQDLLLADNTSYAFNDYLQFLLEHGIASFVLLILTLVRFVRYIQKIIKDENADVTTRLISVHLLYLFITACFHHLFSFQFIQVDVAICCIIIIIQSSYFKRKFGELLIKVFSLNLFIYNLLFAVFCIASILAAESTITSIELLSRSGFHQRAKEKCRSAMNNPDGKGRFFYLYATFLFSENKLDSADYYIKRAENEFYSDKIALYKARIAEGKGLNEEAEFYYIEAVSINPKLFKNRLFLIDYYIRSNRQQEARKWCIATLALPVKIYSEQAFTLKAIIQLKLNQLNASH